MKRATLVWEATPRTERNELVQLRKTMNLSLPCNMQFSEHELENFISAEQEIFIFKVKDLRDETEILTSLKDTIEQILPKDYCAARSKKEH